MSDGRHLARAIALAERGRGGTRPNPLVGCVLVRDGRVVGRGHHAAVGGPHAEIAALAEAGDAARGATAYVSLEPCAHEGRTGPCTTALIDAGVARVVYALADPHPRARGGHGVLEQAGLEVAGGRMAAWAAAQNEVFVTAVRHRRPHVTLKLAQTVDGSLEGSSRSWITGRPARRAVHRLRARMDAVAVGSGTALADDPRLNARHVPAPHGQPRPVVLDARGRTPAAARLVRDGVVVVTTERAPGSWRAGLEEAGAEVMVVPPAIGGGVSLPHALRGLLERGVQALLLEGGARLARAAVAERLVDRLVLHVAVAEAGPHGLVRVAPCASPGPGWRWSIERTGRRGADLEIVAAPEEV